MIKAGKYTVEDSGFTVTTEQIGGRSRRAVVLELPGGIDEAALRAMCSGPIDVVDDSGKVVQTHSGPFRVVSHVLKLTRTSGDGDIAALTARVAELEAQLSQEQSEKESAQSTLAGLNEQLSALRTTLEGKDTEQAAADAPVEAADEAGGV